jgi:hypothetical protein
VSERAHLLIVTRAAWDVLTCARVNHLDLTIAQRHLTPQATKV